ncbi:MAG: hypothetical protein Q4B28_04650 [bacterium]|nr:hypothetical protein [bacterium]
MGKTIMNPVLDALNSGYKNTSSMLSERREKAKQRPQDLKNWINNNLNIAKEKAIQNIEELEKLKQLLITAAKNKALKGIERVAEKRELTITIGRETHKFFLYKCEQVFNKLKDTLRQGQKQLRSGYKNYIAPVRDPMIEAAQKGRVQGWQK